MLRELQTMAYYETYYYANVIDGVLKDTFSYLRTLHDWHEDRAAQLFVTPFPKWSLLHDFSEFTIRLLAYEQIDDVAIDAVAVKGRELWIDQVLRHHGFKVPGLKIWLQDMNISLEELTEDHANEYYGDLLESGELADLFEHLSNEAFFVLFANRSLLANLNQYASLAFSDVTIEAVDEQHQRYLASDGILKRASLPVWARRAVYYRDRGRCVACNCDLTNLISLQNDEHFDHIIPLHHNGLNDVTNIQLLCASCNLKKGHNLAGTWNRYERWY